MLAADWKVQQGKATQAVRDAVRSFPVAGQRLRDEAVRFLGTAGLVGLGFLGLFILHQATLWAAVRPAVAFERAKVVVYTAELVWDATARVGNAGLQMVDAVIPLWNAGSHYVIEPGIYILLDLLALIFTQEPYPGLIKETDVPYAGFTCSSDTSTVSPAWCGRFEYYETRLRDADEGGFQSGSIVLGTATARRLQSATGESLVPVIDVGTVVPGLSGLTSSTVTLVGSVADVLLYVSYTVLSEVAVLLWDMVFIMSKALANVLLSIVRSNMLETVINFAVDLIVILILEIALPMLLATIDLLMCAIDLFFPNGWDTQLQCIDEHCFETDSDAVADLIVFTSVPIVWQRFKAVLSATINSNTGKQYGLSNLPNMDWVDTPSPTLPAAVCAECFVCKVPEVRLVSLLIMTIVGCVKPANVRRFTGGSEDVCRTGGAWYTDHACGPADGSMEFLTDAQWAAEFTAHRRYDETLVQAFAGTFAKRARELGGAGSVDGQTAENIANAWFLREQNIAVAEGDEAAKFYRLVCNEARVQREAAGVPLTGADNEPVFWTGPDFTDYSDGSMAYESTRFLYDA